MAAARTDAAPSHTSFRQRDSVIGWMSRASAIV